MGENCDIESLASLLGCRIGSLPTSYLGLPLGANYKSKAIWQPVIDRISALLESWKTPLLSKGGRLALVKATLAAMLNYFISLFMISVSVANTMEGLFKRFLWDDRVDHHRYHPVDWDFCCTPMNHGGLELGDLEAIIGLFLLNGFGDFGWKEIVYGGRWWWLDMVRNHVGNQMKLGVGTVVVFGSLLLVNEDFQKFIKFKLGSERNISF